MLRRGQATSVVDELLARVGLGEVPDVYPQRLSLGMSRRAAIARAFAIAPDLLLMDEPFVSLDPASADVLRGLLLDLWRQRPTSVLFVTHDLREALLLADRVLLLSAAPGRVLADVAVPLAHPARGDADALEALHAEVSRRHRLLLA